MSEKLLKMALRGHVADFLSIWVTHSNFGFDHAPAPPKTSGSFPKWLTLAVNASWAVVPAFAPVALALRVVVVHATVGYGVKSLDLDNVDPTKSVHAKLKQTMSLNLARIADGFNTEGMVRLAYAELVKERGLTTDDGELKKGLWNLMFNSRYSEGRSSIQIQATAAATKICKIAEKLTKRYARDQDHDRNRIRYGIASLQRGYAISGLSVHKELAMENIRIGGAKPVRQQVYDASLNYEPNYQSYCEWLDEQPEFKAAVRSIKQRAAVDRSDS